MKRKVGQEKSLRWALLALAVLLGGYLLISLLGIVLGLAFSGSLVLGGFLLVRRVWNSWKTRNLPPRQSKTSVQEAQEGAKLEEELEGLKQRMKGSE